MEWTDAEAVADLTAEVPLRRHCVIGGRLYAWSRLRLPEGEVWLPLWLLIEDNDLARIAPAAMLRAGVRAFGSREEALDWYRTQSWAEDATGGSAEPRAAPDRRAE
jgi:hypothetical protein